MRYEIVSKLPNHRKQCRIHIYDHEKGDTVCGSHAIRIKFTGIKTNNIKKFRRYYKPKFCKSCFDKRKKASNRKYNVYIGIDRLLYGTNYYDEKLAIARKNGFDTVIGFVYEAYSQGMSTQWIGNVLGYRQTGAAALVRKIMPLRSRGGDNKWLW